MRTAEFDAFGPWIDEVRTADDVPRLYRSHPLDLAACRLVLKVPRNISRRDASPLMDLYDRLIAVGPERLTILSRRDDAFVATSIGYDQITAIEDSVNLLDGRLTVHTAGDDAAVVVRYNGTSHQVIRALVAVLRELALVAFGPAPTSSSLPLAPTTGPARADSLPVPGLRELGDRDVALVTAYRDLHRQEPQVRLLAAHGRRVLVPIGNAWVRGMHLARPMTLQGALVCVDARELQVLSRREFLVRGNRPVDSIARLAVPLARLDSATAASHPRYDGVQVVTLRAGGTAIEVPVPAGSPAEHALLDVVASSERHVLARGAGC